MARPAERSAPRQLPTFYYHDHFCELLAFVEDHYAHALRTSDREFLQTFRAMTRPARCLYVRLVNRKGRLFALGRLQYRELGDPAPLARELERRGFAAAPGPDDVPELLGAMTCDALRAVLAQCGLAVPRGARKARLVALARDHADPAGVIAAIDAGRWIVQRRRDTVDYLSFLFFGRIQQGTLRFTMRDLGIVRTRDPDDRYEPRFAERDEALECYHFERGLARLRAGGDAAAAAVHAELSTWPEPRYSSAAQRADRLAERAGRALEKMGSDDAALAVYRRGESAACIERQVRILLARGARDAVRDVLETCLDAPRSDEEWLFARDLHARTFGGKRTATVTDVLRSAPRIRLDRAVSDQPEQAVVAWFERRGAAAWRAENTLWRTLFGLVFWDLLFGGDAAASHSPFDALPRGLDDASFHAQHAEAIARRLASCRDRAALQRCIVGHATRHYGTGNAVFGWRQRALDAVFALVRLGDPEAIAAVLAQLSQDFSGLHGFPDLLVRDASGLRFVEVKSPGDQLRRNQLLRLEQLRAAGFRADVLRVDWFVDPDQPYVVVDVETTGGRGPSHRVTEIGAVRMVGDEIVDRFQTLLNPERRIPPAITRLTGISDAMVADAPRFIDIADTLERFLDGAIFVAHNVDFDYGFIGREFRRVGRRFRMPRLCTCATMRRLFPGHGSYSLKALCADFAVELERHHRALCDAEAAAGLLRHINARRADVATDTD